MICEKLTVALQNILPVTNPPPAEEPKAPEEDSGKKTKSPLPPPRPNGFVTRDYAVHGYHLDIKTEPDQIPEIVSLLDENEFFIESITGVDWINENQMEVIYDFSRYDFDLCRVVVRTRVARNNPIVPTISTIYPGANWHERETHDFFGIKFAGHPHLIPLLLPEDADFHPLLKDFKA